MKWKRYQCNPMVKEYGRGSGERVGPNCKKTNMGILYGFTIWRILIWGFDYDFTNYIINKNIECQNNPWVSPLWQGIVLTIRGFFWNYSWSRYSQIPIRSMSGKSSERHAEGIRPPRRHKYISVMFGLLSQSRSYCFPCDKYLRSALRSPNISEKLWVPPT